jgi:hypothetical protein
MQARFRRRFEPADRRYTGVVPYDMSVSVAAAVGGQRTRLQILPLRYWAMHPLYMTEVRMLCSHIERCLRCADSDRNDFHILYDQHPICKVEIAGTVTNALLREDKIVIMVDDGTGAVQCAIYLRHFDGGPTHHYRPKIGDSVIVAGKLAFGYRPGTFNETSREIWVRNIRLTVSEDELAAHWMETLTLHLSVYSKPCAELMPALPPELPCFRLMSPLAPAALALHAPDRSGVARLNYTGRSSPPAAAAGASAAAGAGSTRGPPPVASARAATDFLAGGPLSEAGRSGPAAAAGNTAAAADDLWIGADEVEIEDDDENAAGMPDEAESAWFRGMLLQIIQQLHPHCAEDRELASLTGEQGFGGPDGSPESPLAMLTGALLERDGRLSLAGIDGPAAGHKGAELADLSSGGGAVLPAAMLVDASAEDAILSPIPRADGGSLAASGAGGGTTLPCLPEFFTAAELVGTAQAHPLWQCLVNAVYGLADGVRPPDISDTVLLPPSLGGGSETEGSSGNAAGAHSQMLQPAEVVPEDSVAGRRREELASAAASSSHGSCGLQRRLLRWTLRSLLQLESSGNIYSHTRADAEERAREAAAAKRAAAVAEAAAGRCTIAAYRPPGYGGAAAHGTSDAQRPPQLSARSRLQERFCVVSQCHLVIPLLLSVMRESPPKAQREGTGAAAVAAASAVDTFAPTGDAATGPKAERPLWSLTELKQSVAARVATSRMDGKWVRDAVNLLLLRGKVVAAGRYHFALDD